MASGSGNWWADLGAFLQLTSPPAESNVAAAALRVKPLTPQDAALRDVKKLLNYSLREMQREIMHMRRDEALRIRNIKEHVDAGRVERGRAEARQLVATRRAILRVEQGCDRLRQLDQHMQVMRTSIAIVKFSERAVAIMQSLNGSMDTGKITALSHSLQHETERLRLNMENVNEALDDALEDDSGDIISGDELSEQIVFEQICTECGIRQAEDLPTLPAHANVQASRRDESAVSEVALHHDAAARTNIDTATSDAEDDTHDHKLRARLSKLFRKD